MIAAIARQEEELRRSQAAIIGAEAQGNWLQRSWRPLIMLVFAAIVLVGTFFQPAHPRRHLPFLGPAGNRYRRVCHWPECREGGRPPERRPQMKIVEHWLEGPDTERLRCTKNSRRMEVADTIVLHATEGANAMSSACYLARRDTSVSAHLVVGRRGHVIQLLPFNVEAWHAGESEHAGRKGLNACSVGIEIDNAGRLHRRGDRFFSWFNREYMPDEVFTTVENGRAAYYHRFTREQTDRVAEICRLLKARYLMHWLVRHSDITRRKSDPGPAFPFEEVRRQAGF